MLAFIIYVCAVGNAVVGGYVSFHSLKRTWAKWLAFGAFVALSGGGSYATYRLQQDNDVAIRRLQNGISAIGAAVNAEPRGLGLYLQYAYEWNNYRGATNTPNPRTWFSPIDSQVALRRTPNVSPDNRLDLGVMNSGRPVDDVELTVVLPDGLEMTRGGCWRRPWLSYPMWGRIDRTYSCTFGLIDTDWGYQADYPMMLDSPQGGTYRFEYTITGKDVDPITSDFVVVIAPPTP